MGASIIKPRDKRLFFGLVCAYSSYMGHYHSFIPWLDLMHRFLPGIHRPTGRFRRRWFCVVQ